MSEERKSKKMLIGVLCAIILFISIGFASIGVQLVITADASISDTWNIQITNIEKVNASTNVTEVSKSYDATTANFDVTLKQPGDYATYKITVENKGSINATLSDITESISENSSDANSYTLTPAEDSVECSVLESGKTHTFYLRVEYLSTAVGENAQKMVQQKGIL